MDPAQTAVPTRPNFKEVVHEVPESSSTSIWAEPALMRAASGRPLVSKGLCFVCLLLNLKASSFKEDLKGSRSLKLQGLEAKIKCNGRTETP